LLCAEVTLLCAEVTLLRAVLMPLLHFHFIYRNF
jgi:hypothetical protein